MRSSFLLLGLLMLAPGLAQATMVLPLDLSALTDGAEQIALARVESKTARFTEDRGSIYTEVTMRVEQSLKGTLRAGDVVLVRREGGEAEGVGVKVAGAPEFAVGEEAVVFLERRGTNGYWTVGMAQGKLRVSTIEGQKVVVRDMAGLDFTTGAPPPESRVQPLDDVMARIGERVLQSAHRRSGGGK